jgi:hypothetical protein
MLSIRNKDNYDEIIEKLEACLNFYEENKIGEKVTILTLADGSVINLRIRRNAIAHLLGVNTDFLIMKGMTKYTSAIDILNALIDEPFLVYAAFQKEKMDFSLLFSEYIQSKMKIFEHNIQTNLDNISFICKRGTAKNKCPKMVNKPDPYLIFKTYNDDFFSMLGIDQDKENIIFHSPFSSRLFEKDLYGKSAIEKLLDKQIVTIPTHIEIQDNKFSSIYNSDMSEAQKMIKMHSLINIAKATNARIDITEDYVSSLSMIRPNSKRNIRDMSKAYSTAADQLIELRNTVALLQEEISDLKSNES